MGTLLFTNGSNARPDWLRPGIGSSLLAALTLVLGLGCAGGGSGPSQGAGATVTLSATPALLPSGQRFEVAARVKGAQPGQKVQWTLEAGGTAWTPEPAGILEALDDLRVRFAPPAADHRRTFTLTARLGACLEQRVIITTPTVFAEGISIRKELVHAAAFYAPGGGGWPDEPLTRTLHVPGAVVGAVYPAPDADLSLTAFHLDQPVGQGNSNTWTAYRRTLAGNLAAQGGHGDPGVRSFLQVLGAGLKIEDDLEAQLASRGLHAGQMAHNAGLMVLRAYRGRGLATRLQDLADQTLIVQGFRGVVAETTNKGSYAVMKALGYTLFRSFPYAGFGIPLDDSYTIWYKVF